MSWLYCHQRIQSLACNSLSLRTKQTFSNKLVKPNWSTKIISTYIFLSRVELDRWKPVRQLWRISSSVEKFNDLRNRRRFFFSLIWFEFVAETFCGKRRPGYFFFERARSLQTQSRIKIWPKNFQCSRLRVKLNKETDLQKNLIRSLI